MRALLALKVKVMTPFDVTAPRGRTRRDPAAHADSISTIATRVARMIYTLRLLTLTGGKRGAAPGRGLRFEVAGAGPLPRSGVGFRFVNLEGIGYAREVRYVTDPEWNLPTCRLSEIVVRLSRWAQTETPTTTGTRRRGHAHTSSMFWG